MRALPTSAQLLSWPELERWTSDRQACTTGKVFDRMSKGIREAPGKALIGDLAAESGDRPEGAFGKCLPLEACCVVASAVLHGFSNSCL